MDAGTTALCAALLQADAGPTTAQNTRRFDAQREAVLDRCLLFAALAFQLERQQRQQRLMYIDCAHRRLLTEGQASRYRASREADTSEEVGPEGGQQAPIEVISTTEAVSWRKEGPASGTERIHVVSCEVPLGRRSREIIDMATDLL